MSILRILPRFALTLGFVHAAAACGSDDTNPSTGGTTSGQAGAGGDAGGAGPGGGGNAGPGGTGGNVGPGGTGGGLGPGGMGGEAGGGGVPTGGTGPGGAAGMGPGGEGGMGPGGAGGTGPGGAGGAGGAPVCIAAGDCPGQDTDCATRACVGGHCEVVFAPQGTAVAMQMAMDCKHAECDGQGAITQVPDDVDVVIDGNECTGDVCTSGTPSNPALVAGTPCQGNKLCDGNGACVECVTVQDCPGQDSECLFRTCALGQCGMAFAASGTPIQMQVEGDCKEDQCDGGGFVVNANDDSDTPDDALQCTNDVCTAGVPSNPPAPAGTPCTEGGGVVCNANATCVVLTSGLVINEVDYDQIATDGAEYVEIYNGTNAPISLAGHQIVLVNGSNNTAYLTVDLTPAGTLMPGQFLVLGSTAVTVPIGVTKIDFTGGQTDRIQNGAPDGIALVNTLTATLVDALSYEGAITTVTIPGIGIVSLVEGTVLPGAIADSNTFAASLGRLPNGNDTNDAASDWALSTTLTPGAANVP